jgi:uncharacterized membrane protein
VVEITAGSRVVPGRKSPLQEMMMMMMMMMIMIIIIIIPKIHQWLHTPLDVEFVHIQYTVQLYKSLYNVNAIKKYNIHK